VERIKYLDGSISQLLGYYVIESVELLSSLVFEEGRDVYVPGTLRFNNHAKRFEGYFILLKKLFW
jgi:hypothetical protein